MFKYLTKNKYLCGAFNETFRNVFVTPCMCVTIECFFLITNMWQRMMIKAQSFYAPSKYLMATLGYITALIFSISKFHVLIHMSCIAISPKQIQLCSSFYVHKPTFVVLSPNDVYDADGRWIAEMEANSVYNANPEKKPCQLCV